MIDGQLELRFGTLGSYQQVSPRQRRRNRAHWWFARMRQLVDRAMDWQPSPAPRPEQIWFPSSHRQVGEATQAGRPARPLKNDEREICE
ncbi:MAG TPA: hypothetical protein VN578_17215 [Candidatus Binatia bacterium]|jgi:hypothetical protein|nr:hypothetical protein [Candidatus Binatia bacterium]